MVSLSALRSKKTGGQGTRGALGVPSYSVPHLVFIAVTAGKAGLRDHSRADRGPPNAEAVL